MFTFKLDEATTIGGVVVDEAGKPVADATVVIRVQKKYANSLQRINISYESTRVDGNGKWSYEGVPAEYDSIDLGVWSPTHLGKYGFYPMEQYEDAAALKARNAKLTMSSGVPIHVKVVGVDGAPIAGATVGYGEDRIASNSIPEIRLNGDGEGRLGVVEGTTAILTVMAKGYAPQQKRLTVEKTAMEETFELAPAVPLTGKVVDSDGKPIRGAMVAMDTWRGTRPFAARVTTREDGTFSWSDAPADEVLVDVLMQGYADQRKVMMKSGAENRVQMLAPTDFSAKVVDAETGKPIENFTVIEGNAFSSKDPISWSRNNRNGGNGKNGAFERSFTYPYPIRVMRVEAEGYLPADSDQIAMDGKRHEYTYLMKKGEFVEGVAVGPDGKPLTKARVLLFTPKTNLQLNDTKLRESDLSRVTNVTTGADGSFRFGAQIEPYALVFIGDEGYGQALKEDFEKTKKLEVKPWARVEAEIFTGTKPVAGGLAVMRSVNTVMDDMKNPLKGFMVYRQVKADENGKLVIDRVIPGKMMLAKGIPLNENRLMYASQRNIEPKPGETVKVKLGGGGSADRREGGDSGHSGERGF